MTNIVPTVGRIVLYKVSADDIKAFMGLSGSYWRGNRPKPGDVLPAMIVAVNTAAVVVNLKVMLDGVGDYWAASRERGDVDGQWQWMPYQLGQAAKTEAAEAALAAAAPTGVIGAQVTQAAPPAGNQQTVPPDIASANAKLQADATRRAQEHMAQHAKATAAAPADATSAPQAPAQAAQAAPSSDANQQTATSTDAPTDTTSAPPSNG